MTWGILSKYRNEIYGFAAIWIVLYHGIIMKKCALPKGLEFLTDYLKHGNCGVEVFLFLSGISLFCSLKNRTVVEFYKQRLWRLLVPFLLIDGIYWFSLLLLGKIEGSQFFLNVFLYSFWIQGDKIAWYVALVVLLYFVYPLIFYKILNSKRKLLKSILLVCGCYLFCFLVWYFYPKLYWQIEIALTRIPVFLIGCYCGEFVYKDEKLSRGVKLTSLIILIMGIAYFFEYPVPVSRVFRTTYLLLGPSVALWFAVFLDIIGCVKLNNVLRHLGIVSLEMYLSHMVLRSIYAKSILYTNNKVANYCKYIVLVLIVSYIISLVVNFINNKVRMKRERKLV